MCPALRTVRPVRRFSPDCFESGSPGFELALCVLNADIPACFQLNLHSPLNLSLPVYIQCGRRLVHMRGTPVA